MRRRSHLRGVTCSIDSASEIGMRRPPPPPPAGPSAPPPPSAPSLYDSSSGRCAVSSSSSSTPRNAVRIAAPRSDAKAGCFSITAPSRREANWATCGGRRVIETHSDGGQSFLWVAESAPPARSARRTLQTSQSICRDSRQRARPHVSDASPASTRRPIPSRLYYRSPSPSPSPASTGTRPFRRAASRARRECAEGEVRGAATIALLVDLGSLGTSARFSYGSTTCPYSSFRRGGRESAARVQVARSAAWSVSRQTSLGVDERTPRPEYPDGGAPGARGEGRAVTVTYFLGQ